MVFLVPQAGPSILNMWGYHSGVYIVRPVNQDRPRIPVIETNDGNTPHAVQAEMVALLYQQLPATLLGTAALDQYPFKFFCYGRL